VMTPLSVLIVDDDPALLQALPQTLRLRMGGVTVETADSAAAALDRIAAQDYDAIVTDIKMPGMDGLALLAEIRARRPDTPTLIITGHGENELVVRALRAGASDFIQKPIDRDYFVAALYRAIRAHVRNRRVTDRRQALKSCADELERIVEKLEREPPQAPERDAS
jgi:two-component system, sensor histidine kinase and response regulator